MKTGACRRLAKIVADAAIEMSLDVVEDRSRISASAYVVVSDPQREDSELKVRVSDHGDRYGSDWTIWHDEAPAVVVARLAAHFGREVPAAFTAAAFAQRAAAAARAAWTRADNRAQSKAEILAELVAAMPAVGSCSKIAAGRVLDTLHPDLPRAQRQRLAEAASRYVRQSREIAAAADDLQALAEVARTNDRARAELRARVDGETFKSLRPKGFPRSCWS